MSVKYIDTSPKKVKVEEKAATKFSLKLFLKTVFITIAVTLGILVVINVILAIIIYPQVKVLGKQLETTYNQAKKVEDALQAKNIDLAETEVSKLKNESEKTRKEFTKIEFVKYIPIAAAYYKDGEHALNILDIGIELAGHGLGAIDPFADVLGFTTSKKEELTAEMKAEKVVTEVIPKLIPLVDESGTKLEKIQSELDQINPERYPKGLKIKGLSVQEGLQQAKQVTKEISQIIPEIKPLLLAAPDIAGQPVEKTYLILLQNDKELRATGGFITAYALVKVKGGQIISTESDDIYQLDLKYKRTEIAPDAIRKYIGHNSLPIRDSNISPDYKISAQKFESLYNTIAKMPKVDGVFALDTEFVRLFLEATGPVTTKKTKESWSAQKNRLGIPDVVYKLELYAEKINQSKTDRKGVVGELMDAMMDKVLTSKTEEFPKYFEVLKKAATEKHILFYFHNKTAQNFVEKYNYAGQIHDSDDDYFHLNNSNFGGLKGNIYIKQKVVQDIKIDELGNVTKTVDVTLSNTAKADGWLNSIYLNWMRIYVPKDSILISKKVPKDFSSGQELGKEVFRGYSATYPLNSTTSTFTYRLPFKVKPGQDYKMLLQKQPGVEYVTMIIKINGIVKEQFDLREDKEVTIKL